MADVAEVPAENADEAGLLPPCRNSGHDSGNSSFTVGGMGSEELPPFQRGEDLAPAAPSPEPRGCRDSRTSQPQRVHFKLSTPTEDYRESVISGQSGGTTRTSIRTSGLTFSAREGRTATIKSVATAVSRAPAVATNRFLDACCRRKHWQLIASMFCAVLAVWVHSSSSLSSWLFGKDWNQSWLWWCIAVPMYVYLAIYFARFLGSYLARTWLREISESPIIHAALVSLVKGVVEEPDFAETVAGFLDKDAVVDGIAKLTAAILSSSGVRDAAAGTTACVIGNRDVQDATIEAATKSMKNDKLLKGVEELMGREELTAPLAGQVARLLDDRRVCEACAGLIHEVLEDNSVKGAVHHRAVSLMGDEALMEAGRKGIVGAIFGQRHRDPGEPVSPGRGLHHLPQCLEMCAGEGGEVLDASPSSASAIPSSIGAIPAVPGIAAQLSQGRDTMLTI